MHGAPGIAALPCCQELPFSGGDRIAAVHRLQMPLHLLCRLDGIAGAVAVQVQAAAHIADEVIAIRQRGGVFLPEAIRLRVDIFVDVERGKRLSVERKLRLIVIG